MRKSLPKETDLNQKLAHFRQKLRSCRKATQTRATTKVKMRLLIIIVKNCRKLWQAAKVGLHSLRSSTKN